MNKLEAKPFVMLDIRDFKVKIKGTEKKPLNNLKRVQKQICAFKDIIEKESKDFCGHLFHG